MCCRITGVGAVLSVWVSTHRLCDSATGGRHCLRAVCAQRWRHQQREDPLWRAGLVANSPRWGTVMSRYLANSLRWGNVMSRYLANSPRWGNVIFGYLANSLRWGNVMSRYLANSPRRDNVMSRYLANSPRWGMVMSGYLTNSTCWKLTLFLQILCFYNKIIMLRLVSIGGYILYLVVLRGDVYMPFNNYI